MRFSARAPALALAAALLLAPLSSSAAADERVCGRPGSAPCTILRPPATALPKEESGPLGPQCVIAVGGFASTNGDRAFDPLLAWSDGDPRFRAYHFGYDTPGFRYDSTGSIDESAEALAAFVASLRDECADVHVVTHSMGGAVADRAFAKDLSGVRTYVALAGPHNGATVARIVVPHLAVDPLLAAEVHEILRDGPDPTTRAGHDLARMAPPHRTPRTTATLRLRLATDAFVLRRDTLDRRVDAREYLPDAEWDQLEGHGGVLDNGEIHDVVWATIVSRRPSPDRRSRDERAVADAVSREIEREATALYSGAAQTIASDPGARLALGVGALAAIVARAVRAATDERVPRAAE
ncbi:MAG: hypothetical protein KGK34_11355 [Chloroflexota bacterium]|nr:hypothetical protein [Chloroflexota bacterium]